MNRLMNRLALEVSARAPLFALAALLVPLAMSGCLPSKTGATEVGVRFNKLTGTYSEYSAGATYFFVPLIGDWQVFDISLRNLAMTADVASGDRAGKDDLHLRRAPLGRPRTGTAAD